MNFPIIEKCKGCDRIDGNICRSYYNPEPWWRIGTCPLASHVRIDEKKVNDKKRVGQQKGKKKKVNLGL